MTMYIHTTTSKTGCFDKVVIFRIGKIICIYSPVNGNKKVIL
jgi:hypothetical protein